MGSKRGVLLLNLGTPDTPGVFSVARYLAEFLLDRRVLDIPVVWRYLLVFLLILPTRSFKSAHAYRKIWQEEGSPLKTITQAMADQLALTLGDQYVVKMAMRYQRPKIKDALAELAACQELVVLPLFPQYSAAATGSAIAKTLSCLSSPWNMQQLHVINQFYEHPGFIQACCQLIAPHLDEDAFLLLSYHGLPIRHVSKSGCHPSCDRQQPCPGITASNAFCYRAQCYRTSEAITTELALTSSQHMTTFQSRLGRTPWIKPYTDDTLDDLIARGVRHLVVACPSFVADCLETLEEIGMEARQQWLDAGGERFTLVPCVNSSPMWIEAMASMVHEVES